MNAVWRTLLWKEWREHRGKIAALSTITVGVPLMAVVVHPLSFYSAWPLVVGFCGPLAGLFFGMSAAAGEQSAGTIRFLQSLPVRPAKPAAAKLVWGILAVALPIGLAILAALVWQSVVGVAPETQLGIQLWRVWGISDWSVALGVGAMIASVSILIWTAAVGVNRSDEVRAGAISILVIGGCWAALAWLGTWGLERYAGRGLFRFLVTITPAGAGVVDPPPPARANATWWALTDAPFFLGALASHGALVAWYVGRFGRATTIRPQSIEKPEAAEAAKRQWLAPPRSSAFAAILWKQVRETAPLAGMGAGLILLAVVVAAAATRDQHNQRRPFEMFQIAAVMWMFTGFFVSIVAGVGVFMDDLKPGLHTFWRSRPIPISQWFVVKFLAGGLLTLLTLAIVPAVFGVIAAENGGSNRLFGVFGGPSLAEAVGMYTLAHVGAYAAAIAAMILLRHAVYAAFVALVAPIVVVLLTDWLINRLDYGHVGRSIVAASAAGGIALVVGLTWLALRNDWGWKR